MVSCEKARVIEADKAGSAGGASFRTPMTSSDAETDSKLMIIIFIYSKTP